MKKQLLILLLVFSMVLPIVVPVFNSNSYAIGGAIDDVMKIFIKAGINLLDDAGRLFLRYGPKIVKYLTKYGDDAVITITKYGDDAFTVVKNFGDDGIKLITKYGDDAAKAIANHGDDAVKLVKDFGDDAAKAIANHGDDAVKLVKDFGDDAAKAIANHGDDAVNIISKYANDGVEIVSKYGRNGIRLISNNGNSVIRYFKNYGDDAIDLMIKKPGTGKQIIDNLGKKGIETAKKLGDDGIEKLSKMAKSIKKANICDDVLKIAKTHSDKGIQTMFKYQDKLMKKSLNGVNLNKSVEILNKYGDDGMHIITKYGDEIAKLPAGHLDDGVKVLIKGKTDGARIIKGLGGIKDKKLVSKTLSKIGNGSDKLLGFMGKHWKILSVGVGLKVFMENPEYYADKGVEVLKEAIKTAGKATTDIVGEGFGIMIALVGAFILLKKYGIILNKNGKQGKRENIESVNTKHIDTIEVKKEDTEQNTMIKQERYEIAKEG